MDQKTIWTVAIVAIVIGIGGFWGGMSYGKGQASASAAAARGAGGAFAGGAGGRTRGTNGSAAFGTILSKDATSITIQLMNGPNASSTAQGTGSKIVLYDTSTQVGKFLIGTANDLTVGENVSANGVLNSDGSITAQMIQIRPAGTLGGFRGATMQ